jgi:3',5'-cyclic AMP phosphodiesterase CpdA
MVKPQQIIHLSDLHIGHGEHRRRRTDALVRHITETYDPGTTTVAITGDLTEGILDPFHQGEHERQMQDAARCLMPLVNAHYTVLVTPGNHDYGPRGATVATAMHRQWYMEELHHAMMPWAGGPAPWRLRLAPWDHVIILDSMLGQLGPDVDLARGNLGKKQLKRLDDMLEDTPDNTRVTVMMHHNVEYDALTNLLEDEAELMEVLERHSQKVEVLLQGHEHRWRDSRTRSGIRRLGSGRSTDLHDGKLRYYLITLPMGQYASVDVVEIEGE